MFLMWKFCIVSVCVVVVLWLCIGGIMLFGSGGLVVGVGVVGVVGMVVGVWVIVGEVLCMVKVSICLGR